MFANAKTRYVVRFLIFFSFDTIYSGQGCEQGNDNGTYCKILLELSEYSVYYGAVFCLYNKERQGEDKKQ